MKNGPLGAAHGADSPAALQQRLNSHCDVRGGSNLLYPPFWQLPAAATGETNENKPGRWHAYRP